jgi:hypothetical protein
MGSQDRTADRIRDLIEESDRVRREGERIRGHADSAMRHPFWPERRQSSRVAEKEQAPDRKKDHT